MMRWTEPDANPDTAVTVPAGEPKRASVALFARVCPAENRTVSSVGVVPAGPRRTLPAVVAPVTVTFAATATASVGTPHGAPVRRKSREPFAASAGPPPGPAAPRVSTMRQGAIVVNDVEADECGASIRWTWPPPAYVV